MMPRRSLRIPAVVLSAAAAVVLAAGFFAQTSCGSNCASNCPNATVYIGNLDNQQLAIDDILMSGPACPAEYGAFCVGDGVTTTCTHLTVTGQTQGTCD